MYLPLTDEQTFLREAATDALSRHRTVAAARDVLDDGAYPDLWPTAAEAGWAGLLTSEDAGGVGLGVYEALLVLEECGRTLADARLLGHLPACALLEHAGDADADLRAALAAGEKRAAIVDGRLGERPSPLRVEDPGDVACTSGTQRHMRVGAVSGTVPAALDAVGADVLVVVAERDDGAPVALLVDGAADGVAVRPKPSYDGTRFLATVALDGAAGQVLTVAAARIRDGRDLQRVLLAAESVGSADGALSMARDYAVDRVAFGRAIGSYQAIKHTLVEMLRLVEGARSLLVHAGDAWSTGEGFPLAANAARVEAIRALDLAAPKNIFIHGGIGATWEHDAMLYYRRAEVSRRLAGGQRAAAQDVAAALLD